MRMPSQKKKTKHVKERQRAKKEPHLASWSAVRDHVYAQINFYATRFITIAVVGIVVGFIAIVYSAIALLFLSGRVTDITVALGVLIGVGAIVASLILLAWGTFWRRQVDKEKLF
jgi:uncharacterized membrane protein (DUF485 family)